MTRHDVSSDSRRDSSGDATRLATHLESSLTGGTRNRDHLPCSHCGRLGHEKGFC